MPFQDSSAGGSYYEPQPGMLKGTFIGYEDGPELAFKEKDGTEKLTKNMRWKWRLTNMDDTPVMYVGKNQDGTPGTDAPEQAIVDALSTEATGPKAKARKWAEAHLNRKIEGAVTGAQFAGIMDECVDKTVYLVFGPNQNNKISVANIIPIVAQA